MFTFFVGWSEGEILRLRKSENYVLFISLFTDFNKRQKNGIKLSSVDRG